MKDQENPGFWGKIKVNENGEVLGWLSLTQHSLDVASVFFELAQLPGFRCKLNVSAGVELNDVQIERLAVIALLHDVGKANLGFQNKVFDKMAPQAGHVKVLNPLYVDDGLWEAFINALDVKSFEDWFDPPDALLSFLSASWSHHGAPFKFEDSDQTGHFYIARTKWWKPTPTKDPMRAIADLAQAARQAYPAAYTHQAPPVPSTPALQHRFAGLVMLADWLGSHQTFFPLGRPVEVNFARTAAIRSIVEVGLDSRQSQAELMRKQGDFTAWFGFEPRPLQAAISVVDTDEDTSRLLIAESETGSGKTEAALARFFRLFATGEVDSLYFALPTRVAARELYRRVCKYLDRVFSEAERRPICVLAVPGYARVDNIPVKNVLPDDDTRFHDDPNQYREERQWAAEHPKRFLAATVAVGTIDQALLSVLQSKHAHLRSVCLDRSLLVVDEVHASDSYMRYLLRGLLAHHIKQMKGHAVLLSATLGSVAREEFLQASGCGTDVNQGYESACSSPYPSFTKLDGIPRSLKRSEPSKGKRVSFDLKPVLKQPDSLPEKLAEALRAGARVLIVLNTVARAIAMQRVMEQHPAIARDWLFTCNGSLCPHHGRFAPSDRELLDQAVSDRWGKDSAPGPVVLAGTQTLEQSLDIDADWLITDLCPADVLLQRVGRLHRHVRTRPGAFAEARCTVLTPDCAGLVDWLDVKGKPIGEAMKSGLGSVYADLRTLELTWRELQATPKVEIPRDNRRMVEAATHPERLEKLQGERWDKHGQSVSGRDIRRQGLGSLCPGRF